LVVLYADASALTKLIVNEPESAALREFLHGESAFDTPVTLVSSAVSKVEVTRAARRFGERADERVPGVFRGVTMMKLSSSIVTTASLLPPRSLRTLDAIHLGSALSLGKDIISYDHRLNEAAREAGLTVYSPGMSTSQ
jgi:predicted nucleic acid-binding protein